MSECDSGPPLRLVPIEAAPEPAAELAQRMARAQRAAELEREHGLAQSLAPFRVGSVPYLNTAPLTRGLEDQLRYVVPSELAVLLRRDELDAALVSLTEVLLTDRYDILDGIAIASLGEVQSVLLAHRRPLEAVDVVHCHTASLTSVNLLRVLLAERGLRPEFRPLDDPRAAVQRDFALLIGDPALDFLLGPREHAVWDLGAAWYDLTRLPFVYAVWALRRGVDTTRLRRQLREARDFGLDTLETLVRQRTEYTLDFRKDYLGWHIHYHLGADEKRGVERFVELLRRHGLGPVYAPRYVY